MDKETSELIEKIEGASGPDREMDAEIARAIGRIPPHAGYAAMDDVAWDRGLGYSVPAYTSSIDAAMTLVPEGWWLAGLYFCHPDFRSQQDKEWCAELAGPVTWAVVDREVGEEPQFDNVCASAATPALAICAAALRSRSSS